MQAIRGLRSQSRSSSPAPPEGLLRPAVGSTPNNLGLDDTVGPTRASPLARIQSLTPFHKRPTPPPSPAPLPCLVQDGSYLNTLSTKLSEATNKAIAPVIGTGQDAIGGRRPYPPGRGKVLGQLIETELNASQGNVNLQRAILRLLPRYLTVVLQHLSTQTSQLISVPSFGQQSVTAPLSASTLHALGLAGLAAEILETIANLPSLAGVPHVTGDLAGVRKDLDNIIAKLVNPLFKHLQVEIQATLEQRPIANQVDSVSAGSKFTNTNRGGKIHPAIASLVQLVPQLSRMLTRYTTPSSSATQTQLPTFLISLIWQTMVLIAHGAPALSQTQGASITPTSSMGPTPPHSPPYKRRVLALPDTPPRLPLRLKRESSMPFGGTSRPPSPPPLPPTIFAADAKAAYAALSELPRPRGGVAEEAVDQVFERFAAFRDWVCATSCWPMSKIPEDVPLAIALPVLLEEARRGTASSSSGTSWEDLSVGRMLGYEDEERYRRSVLVGFGRAEECEEVLGRKMVERLETLEGREWTRAVCDAIVARTAL